MAPLNIAWLLQAWALLACASYVAGARPAALPLALLPASLWLLTATAVGQALAWAVEVVRRGPRGLLVVRTVTALLALAVAAVVGTGRLSAVLDRSPTTYVARAVVDGAAGRTASWSGLVAVLLVLSAAAVVAGARLAARVAALPAGDELRGETARRAARQHPGSDLAALVHTDRVAIWRSVPMRRGMAVLTVLPGLVAVGGGFRWEMLGVLPAWWRPAVRCCSASTPGAWTAVAPCGATASR